MDKTARDILRHSFLFAGITDEDFEAAIRCVSPVILDYEKNEIICSPKSFDRRIGFIASGECSVLNKHESGADVRIRTLSQGDSFGIISVFSSNREYPTTIIASKACRVIYITKSDVDILVESYPKIAQRVICFFADRINFLNAKVATFSSSSVEQKMARYILNISKAQGSLTISINKAKAATEIGVGRASLYRVLSQFASANLLIIDNKTVQIIDSEGLERITK